MTIYKNYYTDNKNNTPFCSSEEDCFYFDKEDAIDEIVVFDCNGSYMYHHTLVIEETGVCYTVDLEEKALQQHDEEISEAIGERKHQNSYSEEWRNM